MPEVGVEQDLLRTISAGSAESLAIGLLIAVCLEVEMIIAEVVVEEALHVADRPVVTVVTAVTVEVETMVVQRS